MCTHHVLIIHLPRKLLVGSYCEGEAKAQPTPTCLPAAVPSHPPPWGAANPVLNPSFMNTHMPHLGPQLYLLKHKHSPIA